MGPALYLLQRKDIKSSSNPNSIIYQLSPKYLVLVISQMLSHLMFNITKHGSLYHQLNFKTKGSKAWISHLRTEAGKQKGQDIHYGEPGLWFYLERGVLNIQKDKGWVYTQLAFYLGEGNGIPLQYSWLENPMDGGAWQAAVHGVAKSQTRLTDFTFTFHFHALEKEMATHSSVLAWRIPGTGEPDGLLSMGSHRVRHN